MTPGSSQLARQGHAERRVAAVSVIACLIVVYAFLQHAIDARWLAWVLTPTLVFSYYFVLRSSDPWKPTRGLLTFAAAILVPIAATFTLLQKLFDDDWPAWVFAPLVVFGAWGLAAIVAEALNED